MFCVNFIYFLQQQEFKPILKFKYDYREIETCYRKECDYMNLFQTQASHSSLNKVIDFRLNGKYMSLIQTLFLQTSTDTIFECMHFLKAETKNECIKWDVFIKGKLQRDGFQYNLKSRRNILITFTNCSVWNVGNSRNCCSIIGLIDSDEDRWTLSLISQKLDIELMYLNILGFVCLRTGRNLGVVITNVEDTGSLEKTFGKDCASGSHRWHISRENNQVHHHQWLKLYPPISVDARLGDRVWTQFEDDVLKPYLLSEKTPLSIFDLYLCEFNKSLSNSRVAENDSEFKKIRKMINESKNSNFGFVGNWQGAKSIWTFGADGLHLALRIANHTIKRIIIMTLDYSKFLKDNKSFITKNHKSCNGKKYEILSSEEIIKHFKNCCHIPFHYDPKQPNRLRITSGLFITTYIYIYIIACTKFI